MPQYRNENRRPFRTVLHPPVLLLLALLLALSPTGVIRPAHSALIHSLSAGGIHFHGQGNDTDEVGVLSGTPSEELTGSGGRALLGNEVPLEAGAAAEGEEGHPRFSSLDNMLQWAIEHSDPDMLRKQAQHASRFTEEEFALKRQHIKDVLDAMKMPSDAEMMAVAIGDLNSASASDAQLLHALEELLILVEPIDNANDLVKLGGVPALEKALRHASGGVRTLAAWVLGVAAQNNPGVQHTLLEQGLVKTLMECVGSSDASEEEAVKCFYALSGILRNHVAAQDWFVASGGIQFLAEILKGTKPPGGSGRLRKKAVFLIGDLADQAGQRGLGMGAAGERGLGMGAAGDDTAAAEGQLEAPSDRRADSEPIVIQLGIKGALEKASDAAQGVLAAGGAGAEPVVSSEPQGVLALGGPAAASSEPQGVLALGGPAASIAHGQVGGAGGVSNAAVFEAPEKQQEVLALGAPAASTAQGRVGGAGGVSNAERGGTESPGTCASHAESVESVQCKATEVSSQEGGVSSGGKGGTKAPGTCASHRNDVDSAPYTQMETTRKVEAVGTVEELAARKRLKGDEAAELRGAEGNAGDAEERLRGEEAAELEGVKEIAGDGASGTESEGQGERGEEGKDGAWDAGLLLEALLGLLQKLLWGDEASPDLDLVEKILYTLRSLLRSIGGHVPSSVLGLQAERTLLSAQTRLSLLAAENDMADDELLHDRLYLKELGDLLEEVTRLASLNG